MIKQPSLYNIKHNLRPAFELLTGTADYLFNTAFTFIEGKILAELWIRTEPKTDIQKKPPFFEGTKTGNETKSFFCSEIKLYKFYLNKNLLIKFKLLKRWIKIRWLLLVLMSKIKLEIICILVNQLLFAYIPPFILKKLIKTF